MKTYVNCGCMNIWQVIDDITAIGLQVIAVTSDSVTVIARNGYQIKDIDKIMENRGFY